VKVVQKMPGHASATMTLDTYGHLFEDRLDEVAAAMDAARSAQRANAMKPTPPPMLFLLLPIWCQLRRGRK
jgi:hypothetical protein